MLRFDPNKFFLISFLLLGLLVPEFCLAFDWGQVQLGGIGAFSTDNLLSLVGTIITLAFGVAAIVAVVYLIIGGFSYVTAGGNPEAVEAAKTTIINSIIGLLVVLASYLIVDFVLDQLHASPEIDNPGSSSYSSGGGTSSGGSTSGGGAPSNAPNSGSNNGDVNEAEDASLPSHDEGGTPEGESEASFEDSYE